MKSYSEVCKLTRFGEFQSRIHYHSDRLKLFESLDFASVLHDMLNRSIKDSETVFSLDVFDTVLIRDNSSEIRRFYEIGKRMVAECAKVGATDFPHIGPAPTQIDAFLARHLGTHATYRASERVMGVREGSLTEIHKTAARLLRQPTDLAEMFIEAEIDYEVTRTHLNPSLIDYVTELAARGNKIILVSDMYFHASHIARLLEKHGVGQSIFAKIYSSGDLKMSKASGFIFDRIKADLGTTKFFHIGDSLKSDFIQPRRYGWNAMHLPISAVDLAERRKCHDETCAELSELFGISLPIQRP